MAVQAEASVLGEVKAAERAHLVKVDPLPEKARRQAEAVAAILKSVQVGQGTAWGWVGCGVGKRVRQ